MSKLAHLTRSDGGVVLELAAPRANALEPVFLDEIRARLDEIETVSPQTLTIRAGRNFCSGGDVARFAAAVKAGQGRDYARQVVPKLQEIVLRLVTLPSVVAVAARGAITGGGAGFLFAADCAVVHPNAFVQPYYAQVGFAPDGGWTALLAERIGAAQALNWIISDRRLEAEKLCDFGLANAVSQEPEQELQKLLQGGNSETFRAAKRLIWDTARLALLERRLAAETGAFLERIDASDTREGMAKFLHP
ncbi:enoyl-CoA hydratase/isomerase family protein [uncultured Pelagimonas sp.]|uniref:enoyl-CoA hydratase/isomerase family protein n=1 Tax=uncultured Pelagimonas sp. TaxID=1618102 RepID=UPI00260F766A|nr:enoyl-CoA hydratase/isomerase family protein [uncultured Pelagimonas sp.]